MITLEEAVKMAEERKKTVLGDPDKYDTAVTGTMFSTSKESDRAMFSGFDVDTDDLNLYAVGLADFVMRAMVAGAVLGEDVSPLETVKATWIDGFLVGLLMGRENAR